MHLAKNTAPDYNAVREGHRRHRILVRCNMQRLNLPLTSCSDLWFAGSDCISCDMEPFEETESTTFEVGRPYHLLHRHWALLNVSTSPTTTNTNTTTTTLLCPTVAILRNCPLSPLQSTLAVRFEKHRHPLWLWIGHWVHRLRHCEHGRPYRTGTDPRCAGRQVYSRTCNPLANSGPRAARRAQPSSHP